MSAVFPISARFQVPRKIIKAISVGMAYGLRALEFPQKEFTLKAYLQV